MGHCCSPLKRCTVLHTLSETPAIIRICCFLRNNVIGKLRAVLMIPSHCCPDDAEDDIWCQKRNDGRFERECWQQEQGVEKRDSGEFRRDDRKAVFHNVQYISQVSIWTRPHWRQKKSTLQIAQKHHVHNHLAICRRQKNSEKGFKAFHYCQLMWSQDVRRQEKMQRARVEEGLVYWKWVMQVHIYEFLSQSSSNKSMAINIVLLNHVLPTTR